MATDVLVYNRTSSSMSATIPQCPGHNISQVLSSNITYLLDGPIADEFRDSHYMVLLPSLIYTAVLMTLGLPGNLIVISVYLFQMARTSSRRFFIALAVCDFINCAFGMPVELFLLASQYTRDVPVLCKTSRFASYFLNNTSSCLLIAIAIDRYRRVAYPLIPYMTGDCFKLICIVAVVFSFGTASPAVFIYGTRTRCFKVDGQNNTYIIAQMCHVDDNADPTLSLSFSLYLLIATLVTYVLLTTVYILTTRVLYRRRNTMDVRMALKERSWVVRDSNKKPPGGGGANTPSPRQFRSKSEIISRSDLNIVEPLSIRDRAHSDASGVMINGIKIRVGRTTFILFIVTLIFVLSFIPHVVIVLIRYIMLIQRQPFSSLTSLGHLALRSYLINSAVNPLIYCFFNSDFRTKVKCLLKQIICFFSKQ